MAQDKIKMNGTEIYQPDRDMGYSFTTTYTENSQRTQSGKGQFTAMFTVEQYSYEATNIPIAEASKILKIIAKGKSFTLHHYSIYHAAWRDDTFYVGQSQSISIGSLSEDKEYLSSLSFNMTGVDPL